MSKKSRTLTFSLLLTLTLLLLTASVVVAAPPLDLHIEVPEIIATGPDPFTAEGSAVDEIVICPSGMVEDINTVISGGGNSNFQILHILKQFTCDDLSGTFDIQMVAKLEIATGNTTANWKVVGGTGSYVGLNAHGSLVGTPGTPGEILDVYDGKVH